MTKKTARKAHSLGRVVCSVVVGESVGKLLTKGMASVIMTGKVPSRWWPTLCAPPWASCPGRTRSSCGWSVGSGTTPPCGWAGGNSFPRHASPAPLKPACPLPAPLHHARATGVPQSRRAAPAPVPRVRHRGSGRRAVRVVRHQRHGGAVAGGIRDGVGA
eukprot:gene11758-biopygen15440